MNRHRPITAPTRLTTPEEEHLLEILCARVVDLPGDAEELVARQLSLLAPLLNDARRSELIRAAVSRLVGLDRIELLLADPLVDEIMINRSGQVWTERRGRLERCDPIPAQTLPVVLERILAPLGRRLDRSSPIVDARLPDGSRICAVVPPVAVDGITVAIRRLRRRDLRLRDFGPPELGELLETLLDARANIVISGGTSSGKTSLLGALLDLLPPEERVILIEDTTEIGVDPSRHLVRLEARAPTVEGPPGIGVEDLVRTALRLRPDRIVVGEVRGAEALGLIHALNTGHSGALSTCHANSGPEAITRLETLLLQSSPQWPPAVIRDHLSRSLDAVVHLSRTVRGERQVSTVHEILPGALHLRPLYIDGRICDPPARNRS